ncbi:MAG: type II secretion system F family protein, partial [Culicoidibacterales bacterium]
MFAWYKNSKQFTRKHITYELEQLFILRQGFEQGYAFRESLQCMAAFCPLGDSWQVVRAQITAGEPIQVIFASLQFRQKTIRWLCGSGEWQDLAQATEKTIQLLTWELQVRAQLQKTFAYPLIMLSILLVFGSGFNLFILPQLEFLQLAGTVWLFLLPELFTTVLLILGIIGVGSWWFWKRSHFQQRLQIWRIVQRVRCVQLWGCLRLALHCQLGLGQGQPLATVFAVEESTHFFGQTLGKMWHRLNEGELMSTVFREFGYADPTWLSFFQWQPTNQQ